MKIAIATDFMVTVSEVYRDYVLEIFGVGFSIDFITIAMGYICMISRMDWLGQFGELIDCEN